MVKASNYTLEQMEAIVREAVALAVDKVIHPNLDNDNTRYEEPLNEEDSEMASSYRRQYSYLDEKGEKRKMQLCGRSQADTDLAFQRACVANAGNLSASFASQTPGKHAITFRQFVEDEYREAHLSCLAKSTQGKNDYYLSRYIYPFIGSRQLNEINVNTIISFRNSLAHGSQQGYQKDLSEKTIEDITGFLNKIFKVAVALRRMEDNPVKRELLRKVGQPAGLHKAIDPVTLDQCKQMIPLIENETVRLYAALLFFNGGGMRPEEIMGLRWEDCNLDEGTAVVQRAVTYAGSNRAIDIKATKTETSSRPVILPRVLVDILRPLRQESGFILHGRDPNQPMCNSTWQRTYRRMQETLGIKGQYSNYDLRTTFATQMIEAGASALAVAQMMGHKDTRMVETVYARRRKEGFEARRSLVESLNQSAP